jgi:adenylate kinase family enzyme
MQRIVIIGTSCSGKTTLAKTISSKLNIKHIELDELHWKPEWIERETEDFKKIVAEEIKEKSWVADGNYSAIQEMLWSRSTTIIWLDYPFSTVFYRAILRSFKRAITKEVVCSGNTESFKHSFFSNESIILWVLKTHKEQKERYSKLLTNSEYSEKNIIKLKSQAETNQFINSICY